jgi:integrase
MSVYKRGSRWAAAIDLDRAANGKRRRRYLGSFKSKKEAQAAETSALHERARGIDLAPSKITVADLLARYEREQRARNLGRKTIQEDASKVRNHIVPHIGGIQILRLRTAHLSELYTKLLLDGRVNRKGGLAPKTVRHVHALVKAALSWALRMQLVPINVADAVDLPRVDRSEAKALSDSEAFRLLTFANETQLGPLFTLAFATGARRGELLALKWSAVDFASRTLLVRQSLSETRDGVQLKATKSQRVRCIPLSSIATEALQRQRAHQAQERLLAGQEYGDQDFVFATPLGEPIKPSVATNAFCKIARRAGISTTRLHDARHTAATWLINEGVDVRTVGAILGHAAASTTLNIYAHADASSQVAAMQKLDERLKRARLG